MMKQVNNSTNFSYQTIWSTSTVIVTRLSDGSKVGTWNGKAFRYHSSDANWNQSDIKEIYTTLES